VASVALVEPYYTGSHARWADGLTAFSSHDVRRFTLPGRFWKWRMHGGAVTLARRFLAAEAPFDLILATDMLDLATFLALTRGRTRTIPAAVYFHENQLTYPPPPGEKRDLHYGFVNYTSLLAADRALFNSAYHRDALFDELHRLLKHFPDFNEVDSLAPLWGRSEVLPLALDLRRLDRHRPDRQPEGPLRIVWNHRWEYDKRPETFFEALYALQEAGVAFEVSILGESFRQQPAEFLEAQGRLAGHIRHFGYTKDTADYARRLWEADVQVSCAIQDFFGASTCEAMYCGCLPILPDRLNYPAFIPTDLRERCLYTGVDALIDRLKWACEHVAEVRATSLRARAARYDWSHQIADYDRALTTIVEAGPLDPFGTA
jgi:glycosyltransferase involved in cell wall biosynthesis